MTKKNRKVRRLKELYPEVTIKVLYQRDYLNLLVKFGLENRSELGRARLGDWGTAETPPLPVASEG